MYQDYKTRLYDVEYRRHLKVGLSVGFRGRTNCSRNLGLFADPIFDGGGADEDLEDTMGQCFDPSGRFHVDDANDASIGFQIAKACLDRWGSTTGRVRPKLEGLLLLLPLGFLNFVYFLSISIIDRLELLQIQRRRVDDMKLQVRPFKVPRTTGSDSRLFSHLGGPTDRFPTPPETLRRDLDTSCGQGIVVELTRVIGSSKRTD